MESIGRMHMMGEAKQNYRAEEGPISEDEALRRLA